MAQAHVSVPAEAYAPLSPVLLPQTQCYPLMLDVQGLVFLVFAQLPLAPFTISVKSEGVLFSTTKPLPINAPRFSRVARRLKETVADLAYTYFTPRSQSQFYTRLLPIILAHRFDSLFSVSLKPPLIVWKEKESLEPEEVKAYVESIRLSKHPLSGFNLEEDGGIFLDTPPELFRDFQATVKFSIPINPEHKFILRKFTHVVERDMRLLFVTCQKPQLINGIFGPNDTNVPCATVHEFCKQLFLDRLEQYANQIHVETVNIQVEQKYAAELCKAFNLHWMSQPAMVRYVRGKQDTPGSINLLCLVSLV